jgi:hypothetical protein
MLMCEVCNKEAAFGTASVPGVPYSAAYCRNCLAADAHPLDIVVANTACIGGLERSADWWKEIVDHTIQHLGVTMEDFNQRVKQSMNNL